MADPTLSSKKCFHHELSRARDDGTDGYIDVWYCPQPRCDFVIDRRPAVETAEEETPCVSHLALRETERVLGPDASGRAFADLLLAAAAKLHGYGGGALAACLRMKAEQLHALDMLAGETSEPLTRLRERIAALDPCAHHGAVGESNLTMADIATEYTKAFKDRVLDIIDGAMPAGETTPVRDRWQGGEPSCESGAGDD